MNTPVLLRGLRDTAALLDFTPREWSLFLVQARRARLLGRVAVRVREGGLWGRVPVKAADHLTMALRVAARHETMIRWEVDRLQRALLGTDIPVMLLKGAAYAFAGLALGRGRLPTDLDVMVRASDLPVVEAAITAQGWAVAKPSAYDQHYYRAYMHELPPYRHAERGTVLDVHHRITPPSGRLRFDPGLLWAAARPLDGTGLFLPAPVDLTLHAAIHLFQDGEISGGLRDLVDCHDLLAEFGREPGFWDELRDRALAFGAARPLYYAMHFGARLLGTPVPPERLAELHPFVPAPARRLMDALVPAALAPGPVDPRRGFGDVAAFLLYLRAHWLRMPPHRLLPHLARKAAMGIGRRGGAGSGSHAGRRDRPVVDKAQERLEHQQGP